MKRRWSPLIRSARERGSAAAAIVAAAAAGWFGSGDAGEVGGSLGDDDGVLPTQTRWDLIMKGRRRGILARAAGAAVVLGLIVVLAGRTQLLSSRRRMRNRAGGGASFPTLRDTREMASLSLLVYAFRHATDDGVVCPHLNARNFSLFSSPSSIFSGSRFNYSAVADQVAPDIRCDWYHHDRENEGTQVMIVHSRSLKYVAVVFAGTDDIRTSLLDADILLEPFAYAGNYSTTTTKATTAPAPPSSDDAPPLYPLLPDPRIRIHAGFDKAVFAERLFDELVVRVQGVRDREFGGSRSWWRPWHRNWIQPRLFTTGHSLGAANSVLTAVATS